VSGADCPSAFRDGYSGVYICVWPVSVMEEKHFLHFSCGTCLKKACIQTLWIAVGVHCQIPVQEDDKNNNFLLQKGCSHDFFC